MNDIGKCDHCGKSFEYNLLHNGFNDSAYSYCDQCGMLSILDGWKIPEGVTIKIHQKITQDVEPFLAPCQCGGKFKADAYPRCPHCNSPLSPDKASEWIEANAPGTEKGWRWQKSWNGLYAISIDKNCVKNNWKMV